MCRMKVFIFCGASEMQSQRNSASFIKTIEASRVNLFVFVEGKVVDPAFYDKIFNHYLSGLNVEYEVVIPSRILPNLGGKDALIRFHDELAGLGRVNFEYRGVKKSCVFIVDKDVDDIVNSMRSDKSIIYTGHYCAENYLIVNGDVRQGIINSCQIPKRELSVIKLDLIDSIRVDLRPWVVHCLMNKMRCVNFCSGYANDPPAGFKIDDYWISDVSGKSGISKSEIELAYANAEKIAEERYKSGAEDSIIKGKWYFARLECIIKENFSGYNISNFQKSFQTALLSTLIVSDDWALYFFNKTKHAIEYIGVNCNGD